MNVELGRTSEEQSKNNTNNNSTLDQSLVKFALEKGSFDGKNCHCVRMFRSSK